MTSPLEAKAAPLRCRHECDRCDIVLVATPVPGAIAVCNQCWKQSLYKEPVDIQRLLTQHRALTTALTEEGVQVIDAVPDIYDLEAALGISPAELGNLVFTRDSILCTPKGIVMGGFKERVRQAETAIIRELIESKYGHKSIKGEPWNVSQDCHLEGGDFFPAGDRCFIACGNRTTYLGILCMMERELFGTEFVSVVCQPPNNDMHLIHLDCFMGLVGYKYAVVWEHAAAHFKVDVFRKTGADGYKIVDTGVPFGEHLKACGYTLILVNDDVQKKYGCNLLDLGNGAVLTQDDTVTQELQERGFRTRYIQFDEVHKMYGGIRCATQVIRRIAP